MISIEQVSKSYKNSVKAVDRLSLQVHEGEVYGFLGPNGAGKTTTIRMLTGILRPDAGNIRLNGFNIVSQATMAKRQFALVPDDIQIYPRLSGAEWLRFVGTLFEVARQETERRIASLAERFAMDSAIDEPVGSYSHGMKQKIALMAGLLHEPRILVLCFAARS